MHYNWKKVLIWSSSQWSTEVVQGFLHRVHKASKEVCKEMVGKPYGFQSGCPDTYHSGSQLKVSNKKWHLLTQKVCQDLSSKENRTQNKQTKKKNPTPLK